MKVAGFGELENLRKSLNQKDSSRSSQRTTKSGGYAKLQPDAVELSGEAKLLGKLSQVPDVRAERVQEIKQQVESGEYLTEDKVRDGVRKMLESL